MSLKTIFFYFTLQETVKQSEDKKKDALGLYINPDVQKSKTETLRKELYNQYNEVIMKTNKEKNSLINEIKNVN